MLEVVRNFLDSKYGRWTAGGIVFVAICAMFFALRNTFGDNEATAGIREQVFICSETGKTFSYDIEPGMSIPVPSPYSDNNTGYLPELCYWTKDGGVKDEPTYVLLKQAVDPESKEETYCPDCGRLVVRGNPPAIEGPGNAPPLKP